MTKKYIFAGMMIAVAGMCGCALEDPVVSCGSEDNHAIGFIIDDPTNPVTSMSQVEEGSILKEEYFSMLLEHHCPIDWYCVPVSDDNNALGMACSQCAKPTEIRVADKCIDIYSSSENCGQIGHECQEYESCENGKCVETAQCKQHEHPSKGQCKKDTIKECGSVTNDCTAIPGWKDGECIEGTCIINKCTKGYTLSENECLKYLECQTNQHPYEGECEKNNMDNCGSHGKQCLSVAGFEEGYCSTEGECVASNCQENFCLEKGVCFNGKYDAEHCGVQGNCQTCNKDEKCFNGNCIVNICSANQHIITVNGENACEDDTMENCGSHGNSCTKENVESMACEGGKCIVQACAPGYHLYNSECEMDDVNNCGAHDNACTKTIGGWATGICKDKTCQVNSCTSGHVYNNTCEADSLENCGEHDKTCLIENGISECTAGVCQLLKCNSGYYEQLGRCNQTSAYGGAEVDPWGLIWDSANRDDATHSDATKICNNEGGRLPTPTEVGRNNRSRNESTIGNSTDTTGIWTDTVHQSNTKIEIVDLAKGTIKEMSPTKKTPFRCVWDAVALPSTFTGYQCNGAPGTDGCTKVQIGNIEYTVDARERPAQYWFQAAEECRKAGARLPFTSEFPPIIVHGLSNGSMNWNWATPTNGGKAAAFKWDGIVSSLDVNSSKGRHFGIEFSTPQPFRCVSEPVKVDSTGQPVFSQPNALDESKVFIVDPQLRLDRTPRTAANYFEADYICMKDGGRLASVDELSAAIKKGLSKPSNDNGKQYYFTSTPVSTAKNLTLKFGESSAPYYYTAHNKSSESYKKPLPYFCSYRPDKEYDYADFESKVSDETMFKVTESGVSHYIYHATKNTAPNGLDMFNKMVTAMKSDMLVPNDSELIYMIRHGLKKGPGDYMVTSKLHYNSDTFGSRSFTWSGTGNENYSPAENLKLYKYTDGTQPYRMYATTTIH